ncbi:unnamed protein product [Leuciscus chuanchicus]
MLSLFFGKSVQLQWKLIEDGIVGSVVITSQLNQQFHAAHRSWSAEVEDTLKKIQGYTGVIGSIVVNAEGIPIRTALDNATAVKYVGLLHQLTMKTRSTIRDIDPQDDLTFLRIRSKKHEIMIKNSIRRWLGIPPSFTSLGLYIRSGSSSSFPCLQWWRSLKSPNADCPTYRDSQDQLTREAGVRTRSGPTRNKRKTHLCGNMAEVEDTLKRIQGYTGVIGSIVVNAEGIPIRTTLDNSTTVQYVGLLHQLTMKTRSTIRDIDPQNDLTFLRIRSKKHEIMVAPDKEFLMIVIQSPTE